MSQRVRTALPGEIHALFRSGTGAGLSDGQLLEQFAGRRDETAELAFTVLVERHGPTVIQVCRRLLRDAHDAEDAFQATFLVLARRAHAIERRDSVGSWLYGVALRVAADARHVAARRRMHEQRAAAGRTETSHDPDHDDLGVILVEEVGRLPEPLRAPVVLCYLEGCTSDEAARRLGWPVGTVKSRLTRARRRLQDRLRRRGLAPDEGAALLATAPGAPTLPHALVGSTVAAAARFASFNTASAPAAAAVLAQGVIRTMFVARSLRIAALALALATMAPATVLLAQKVASGGGGPGSAARGSRSGRYASIRVEPGTLRITQVTQGILRPGRTSDAYNRVPGSRTIVKILPEGTKVKSGQLVCQLDSSDLSDQLALLRASGAAGPELAQLRRQIENCRVYAGGDGIVLHANDPARFGRPRVPNIANGMTVRERQKIFAVYDLGAPLRVDTKVPEAIVDRVRPGAPARVRVEVLGRTLLNGRVERMNDRPDAQWYTDADIATQARLYTAIVPLEKVEPKLRPGMNAQVEILIKERTNVLTVPIRAISRFEGKDHVAVPGSDGGYTWREVTLGERNAERIEVTKGLKSGESVIQNAAALKRK